MPVFHTFSSRTSVSNDRKFNLDQGFVVKISLCLSDRLNITEKHFFCKMFQVWIFSKLTVKLLEFINSETVSHPVRHCNRAFQHRWLKHFVWTKAIWLWLDGGDSVQNNKSKQNLLHNIKASHTKRVVILSEQQEWSTSIQYNFHSIMLKHMLYSESDCLICSSPHVLHSVNGAKDVSIERPEQSSHTNYWKSISCHHTYIWDFQQTSHITFVTRPYERVGVLW